MDETKQPYVNIPPGVKLLLAPSACNIVLGSLAFVFLLIEKVGILLHPFVWLPVIYLWFACSYLFLPLGASAILWSLVKHAAPTLRIKICAFVVGGLVTSMFVLQFATRSLNLRLH